MSDKQSTQTRRQFLAATGSEHSLRLLTNREQLRVGVQIICDSSLV